MSIESIVWRDVIQEFAQHVSSLACERASVDYRYTVNDPLRRLKTRSKTPSSPSKKSPTRESSPSKGSNATTSTAADGQEEDNRHSGVTLAYTTACHSVESAVANVINSVTTQQGSIMPIKFRRLSAGETGGAPPIETPATTADPSVATTPSEEAKVTAQETGSRNSHSVEKLRVRVKMIDDVPHVMVRRPEESTARPMPLKTYLETVYQPFVEAKRQIMQEDAQRRSSQDAAAKQNSATDGGNSSTTRDYNSAAGQHADNGTHRSPGGTTQSKPSVSPSSTSRLGKTAPFGSTSPRFSEDRPPTNSRSTTKAPPRLQDGKPSTSTTSKREKRKPAVPKQQSVPRGQPSLEGKSQQRRVNKKEYSRIREKLLSRINEEDDNKSKATNNRWNEDENGPLRSARRKADERPKKHSHMVSQPSRSTRSKNPRRAGHSQRAGSKPSLSDKTQALVRDTVFSRLHSEKQGAAARDNILQSQQDPNNTELPPTPPPPPPVPRNRGSGTASQDKEIRWKGLNKYKAKRDNDEGALTRNMSGTTLDQPSEKMTDAELNKLVMQYSQEVGSEADTPAEGAQPAMLRTGAETEGNERVETTPSSQSAGREHSEEKRKQLLQKFIQEKCEDVPQRMRRSIRKYSEDASHLQNGENEQLHDNSETTRRNSAPSPQKSYTQYLTGQNRVLFSSAVPALPDGQKVAEVLGNK
eukprot:gb/GECG01001312.1/.p1 GENE.gb/GECG01001312.1/~~gb/GECG01001312.1/.p1  ORF type:complete len:698 (+),score=109.16 gb/GECG01001312.1/:1-2094(+)